MKNFLIKIAQFMEGRYGHDNLNLCLLILWIITEIIWVLSRSWVFGIVAVLLIVLTIYRSFSKNIQKRMYENRKYMSVINFIQKKYKLIKRMWTERDTYKYIKCPNCNAQLRVKKVKGDHRVHCPKCGKDFRKKIWGVVSYTSFFILSTTSSMTLWLFTVTVMSAYFLYFGKRWM